jgi:hypothetical protein
MKHLAPEELVDAAESALPPGRAAHLEACEACREQVRAIGATLREMNVADVPEPSPLFWDHLSSRVRDAVAHEGIAPERWSWVGTRIFMPVATVMALVIAIVSGVLLPRLAKTPPAPAPVAVRADVPSVELEASVDPDNAEVWAVLTAAAADMEIDEAHAAGLGVRPATVDRAVQRLNKDELAELGRLLQSELKRPGN